MLIFFFVIVFRDQLLAQLKTVKGGDLDAISAKLDILGNTLEYRKYGDSLFEILITGGILGKLFGIWCGGTDRERKKN